MKKLKTIFDSIGRLSRLLKFTSGELEELIKDGIYQNADGKGYERAKQLLLIHRYGDPHKVLCAFIKELKGWKSIKLGDSASLGNFHTFFLKMNGVVFGEYWNTLENLCSIISKLPGNSKDRWNRKVFKLRKEKQREPYLDDLIRFVNGEVEVASDPLFLKEALDERSNQNRNQSESPNLKTLLTKLKCQLCDKAHDIENCPLYKDKILKEKIRLLVKAKLCFGCFCKSHLITSCKEKRIYL